MPDNEESTAKVTMLMLYKELRETKEVLIEMRADLQAQKKTTEDHEDRIRQLEQFKWLLVGVSLAAGGVGAAITKVIGA
jgi:6-phosphogluconolactonase/glucosamine-6-phosphate isomerase/deaminase